MSELEHRDINWVRIDTAIMLIGKYSAYDEQEFREDMYALLRRSKRLDELESENAVLKAKLEKARERLELIRKHCDPAGLNGSAEIAEQALREIGG